MFTNFILWLSNFFTTSFKILPIIGFVTDWGLTIFGFSWFFYWCFRISKWENK